MSGLYGEVGMVDGRLAGSAGAVGVVPGAMIRYEVGAVIPEKKGVRPSWQQVNVISLISRKLVQAAVNPELCKPPFYRLWDCVYLIGAHLNRVPKEGFIRVVLGAKDNPFPVWVGRRPSGGVWVDTEARLNQYARKSAVAGMDALTAYIETVNSLRTAPERKRNAFVAEFNRLRNSYGDDIEDLGETFTNTTAGNYHEFLSVILGYRHGFHVFRPSRELCEQLLYVNPRVTAAEYAQPYPLMLIQWPEGWRIGGRVMQLSLVAHGPEFPGKVYVQNRNDWDTANGDYNYQAHFFHEGGTLADQLGEVSTNYRSDYKTQPIDPAYFKDLVRLPVNACLWLVSQGVKQRLLNPELDRKLRERRRKSKDKAEIWRLGQMTKFAPTLIEPEQEVVIRPLVVPSGEERAGGKKKPHVVSGHMKRQPYGKGRELRRVIYVAPYVTGGLDRSVLSLVRTGHKEEGDVQALNVTNPGFLPQPTDRLTDHGRTAINLTPTGRGEGSDPGAAVPAGSA